jgi:Zn-dependent peptidase ImmA (M78 family)
MLEDLPAADEITKHVDRLLRQADAYGRYPTPVDDLVQAARLQRSDDYVLDESLISKAPLALRGLLRSARHKIQGLLDRRARVIHVSPTLDNEGKQRFVLLHETSHGIIPHQRDLLYADDNETLSPATNLMFEREANQAAAELLFQRNDFAKTAAQFEISLDTVRYLAQHYGSSFHAALRRYAETHAEALAVLVLGPTPVRQDPATWRRYEALASPAWTIRFGRPTWPTRMTADRHPFLLGLDGIHADEHTLRDGQGVSTAIQVETTQTPYRSFVLLWLPGRRRLIGRRKVIVPATNP